MATKGPEQRRLPVERPATIQEILDAQRAGEACARAGESVESCPWRTADDDRTRFLRRMWVEAFYLVRAEEREGRT